LGGQPPTLPPMFPRPCLQRHFMATF